MDQPADKILHASCVCHAGQGLLILGPSGAGKSALALQMLALGAALVADDQCKLRAVQGRLLASPPAPLAGLIEARGIGLLRLPYIAPAPIIAAVDLTPPPAGAPPLPPRMPSQRHIMLADIAIDFLHFQPNLHFPSVLMCYLLAKGTA